MNAIVETSTIRRFQRPDIDRHGPWLLPRLAAAFPHLNERSLIGFLNGLLYSNDVIFLYQPTSVALAQLISAHTLEPKPVVWERFVWCKDPKDEQQQKDAANFYVELHRWAQALKCQQIVVEERTDVPHDLIKQKLGRIFSRQQQFVRV